MDDYVTISPIEHLPSGVPAPELIFPPEDDFPMIEDVDLNPYARIPRRLKFDTYDKLLDLFSCVDPWPFLVPDDEYPRNKLRFLIYDADKHVFGIFQQWLFNVEQKPDDDDMQFALSFQIRYPHLNGWTRNINNVIPRSCVKAVGVGEASQIDLVSLTTPMYFKMPTPTSTQADFPIVVQGRSVMTMSKLWNNGGPNRIMTGNPKSFHYEVKAKDEMSGCVPPPDDYLNPPVIPEQPQIQAVYPEALRVQVTPEPGYQQYIDDLMAIALSENASSQP